MQAGTGTSEHLQRRLESRAHAAQLGAVTHGPPDLVLPLQFPSRVRTKKENFEPWAQGPVCPRPSSSPEGGGLCQLVPGPLQGRGPTNCEENT